MRCANCGAELGWVMGPTLCGVCQKAQLAAQEAARRLNERVEAILVDPVAPMQDRRPLTRLEQQHEAALKVTRLTRELNEATREALELGVDVYVGARNRAGDGADDARGGAQERGVWGGVAFSSRGCVGCGEDVHMAGLAAERDASGVVCYGRGGVGRAVGGSGGGGVGGATKGDMNMNEKPWGAMDAPKAVQAEGALTKEVRMLSCDVEELRKALEVLMERLQPVMGPEVPTPGTNAVMGGDLEKCGPLTLRVMDARARIRGAVACVSGWAGRLEV